MKKITIITLCVLSLICAKNVHAKESCLVTVTSPVAPTVIDNSFLFSGTLDRYAEARGCKSWNIMEKTIGTVSVYDESGVRILGPVVISGPESHGYPSYDYDFPISFSQTIILGRQLTAGKIVLTDYGEDDPDEGEEVSTKTIFIGSSQNKEDGEVRFTKTLRYGMKKDKDVRRMQETLKKLGFFKGEAVGDFGPKTREALKKYQKYRGIEQTGTCGPKTRAWLNEDL